MRQGWVFICKQQETMQCHWVPAIFVIQPIRTQMGACHTGPSLLTFTPNNNSLSSEKKNIYQLIFCVRRHDTICINYCICLCMDEWSGTNWIEIGLGFHLEIARNHVMSLGAHQWCHPTNQDSSGCMPHQSPPFFFFKKVSTYDICF